MSLKSLARALVGIDRNLLERLASSADVASRRALERAGAKLRSRIAGSAKRMSTADLLKGVPNGMVAATLGPSRVKAFGLEEDELLEDSVALWIPLATKAILGAQRETVRRVTRETGGDVSEEWELRKPQAERWNEEATTVLAAGLLVYLKTALYAPQDAVPTRGEFDDLMAPRGAIREAVSAAGGTDDPRRGVGTGDLSREPLAEAGVSEEAIVWDYGPEPRNTFEPHEELDGMEFSSLDDIDLSPPPGYEWIGDRMFPGDHEGCLCLVLSVYGTSEPVAASAHSASNGKAAGSISPVPKPYQDVIIIAEDESIPDEPPTEGTPPESPSIGATREAPTPSGAGAWEALWITEGEETDDRRYVVPGASGWRDPPLPLMMIRKTTYGHDEAILVGVATRIWREGNGIMAHGLWSNDEVGAEAMQMVGDGMMNWISIDPIDADISIWEDEKGFHEAWDAVLIGGATIVPFPAQGTTWIRLADPSVLEGDDVSTVEPPAEEAITAAGVPVRPPAEWFDDPKLEGPTDLTITEDGRVFGHIATWGTCHIGRTDTCLEPPRGNGYRYYGGAVLCAGGEMRKAGQLTFNTGHASRTATAMETVEHYDHTGAAGADIAVGDDAWGIWAAGALRSDLTEEQVRSLRAAKPSGDWRAIGDSLEMVAVLAVNVPGFPIPHAETRVAGGVQLALVAAGHHQHGSNDSVRIATLERHVAQLTEQAVSGFDERAGIRVRKMSRAEAVAELDGRIGFKTAEEQLADELAELDGKAVPATSEAE